MPSVCAPISLQICHLFVRVPLFYAIWMWRADLSNSTWKILLGCVFFLFKFYLKKCWKNGTFGRILVLAVYYFLLKLYLKKCWKIRFCSFWSNCGFGVAFFPKIISIGRRWTAQTNGIPFLGIAFLLNFQSNWQKFWKFSFLLVESWFRWLLFSVQILLEKVLKKWHLWPNLGFGCVFSSAQILLEKVLKN